MKTFAYLMSSALLLAVSGRANGQEIQAKPDWLIDPTPYRAVASSNANALVLENGLARLVLRLAPNAAAVDLHNLITGEHLLRAISPAARVTLDGVQYEVGGLNGQPVDNYLKAEWLNQLTSNPQAYRFAGWTAAPIQARFPWLKRREWMSKDLPWPPPGRHVILRFVPPAGVPRRLTAPAALQDDSSGQSSLKPEIEVHYEIYDGLPLFSKWLVIRNTTPKPLRVNSFVSEELRLMNVELGLHPAPGVEFPPLHVETDYSFGSGSPAADGGQRAVCWGDDAGFARTTQSGNGGPTLLQCKPPLGPDQEVAAGASFETCRAFELLLDSTERERCGLAMRRMYRTIAPWSQENPLMFHKLGSSPATIREAIQQAHEVGFEMIIMSFGSGFNFENSDPTYLATYRQLADEARAQGIVLGGYSLLASRAAGADADNTQGSPAMYGVMPCLGSEWGHWYLAQLRHFLGEAGLGVLEHDGSYPGDKCAATNHPYHHGLEDSQWVQWRAITDFYKWCAGHGVYINIPDWYFLAGGAKCVMSYRESNWSLPRAEQVLIERQNMFDGTWQKTSSMGWMFVPLSEYGGGGAAATIEPLDQHRDQYEARLANLLGFGVQACYRGPRLYDTEATKALVKEWVTFYKTHRQVLDGDIIHLRRANGLDWDGILHVNPAGKEKGLLMLYNPLHAEIRQNLSIPLYYTGLANGAKVREQGGHPLSFKLNRNYHIDLPVTIPKHGFNWFTME